MHRAHLSFLVCPECGTDLRLETESPDPIEEGTLFCDACGGNYPIIRSIPRFVPLDNYSSSFGFEWLRHSRTQYDSHTGTTISRDRFFDETQWPEQMEGEVILEVGSGSGRFTEIALSTGATIVSVDYSVAVDANQESNGHNPNLCLIQADLYRLPLRKRFFDRVLCIGVLQHTPDVKRSFFTLTNYPKPSGKLVVDVYRRHRWPFFLFQTRYFVRPLTRHLSAERLYGFCQRYISTMWPLARLIRRIPFIGPRLNWILLIPDYWDQLPLDEEQLLEWAILDAFDILSPRYDDPQYLETLLQWFVEAGLVETDVGYGYNGVQGRGISPAERES